MDVLHVDRDTEGKRKLLKVHVDPLLKAFEASAIDESGKVVIPGSGGNESPF